MQCSARIIKAWRYGVDSRPPFQQIFDGINPVADARINERVVDNVLGSAFPALPCEWRADHTRLRLETAVAGEEAFDHVDAAKSGCDPEIMNRGAALHEHLYRLLEAPIKSFFKRRPRSVAIDGS